MSAPVTRPEEIARRLRREILGGRYKAGERLPAEREIASRLGVHRSSVREALRKLEELRLVVIRRGGGARVRPIEGASFEVVRDLLLRDGGLDDVVAQQVLDVREMLITGAARLAAERGDAASIARARALSKTLASPKTTEAAFLQATEELFELMATASGNLVLRLLRNGVHSLFASRTGARRPPRLRSPETLRALGALDAALARRDAPAVEEAVRAFVRATRPRALALLSALAEATSDHDAERDAPPLGAHAPSHP
jgi:GntR family transcriptional repressor for pyruvate dehydrogenase complex